MSSRRRQGSKHGRGLADMSLPPEMRGRRRRGRFAVPLPAQLDHGQGARAERRRREGERKMRRHRQGKRGG